MWARLRSHIGSLRQARTARAALWCLAAVMALPGFELGYRLQTNRPVLIVEDWRAGRIEDLRFGDRIRFDPQLGWAVRDDYEGERYNTLQGGIRRNFCEKAIRSGGLLAVGDAFTGGGVEVADSDTWPAQLERIADTPVLNAGVGGYATDQIVLRAEQLLAEAEPRTLIVSLNEDSIERASYSSYGTSKPYYTLDNGALVYHAPEPISGTAAADWTTRLRDILGYSAVLDAVLGRVAPLSWLGEIKAPVFQTVDSDAAAVSCALLKRLKARTDEAGVRLLLLMQHGRKTVVESGEPGKAVTAVAACTTAAGLEVVDQLASLRAAVAADPGAADELYLSGGFGQMTRAGNRATAELLDDALGKVVAAQ